MGLLDGIFPKEPVRAEAFINGLRFSVETCTTVFGKLIRVNEKWTNPENVKRVLELGREHNERIHRGDESTIELRIRLLANARIMSALKSLIRAAYLAVVRTLGYEVASTTAMVRLREELNADTFSGDLFDPLALLDVKRMIGTPAKSFYVESRELGGTSCNLVMIRLRNLHTKSDHFAMVVLPSGDSTLEAAHQAVKSSEMIEICVK